MPTFQLPDGGMLSFDRPVTGAGIAARIGPGLARQAIGIMVDGVVLDLSRELVDDATIRIITANDDDPEALRLLRHSCAHLLAEAVCAVLPGTRLAYGPATEAGFFYDLAPPRPVSDADFPAIEAKMAEIAAADRPFTRTDLAPPAGLARTANDKYKHDNAERALAAGATSLSFYATGEPGRDWEDLCTGPHVPRTGFLAAAKVLKVSGAYWHGDQASDQLTRIYGTCFATAKALRGHLQQLAEAERRDHRVIGREMDLFHLEAENPGQIYWHPAGWTLYRTIVDYVRGRIAAAGYVEVKTPELQPRELWERSGHWAKYRQNMFITREEDREINRHQAGEHGAVIESPASVCCGGVNREFSLKPMNCPGHITIFKQGVKSWRDLPLRMAEFGSCVRYEPSGALHGIMRVRGFVQDDAHIFCTETQIGSEVTDFCALLTGMYRDFGFDPERVAVKFSTRPPVRVGSDADWDRAEAALRDAVAQAGLAVTINPGEGAFYGPKLEFVLRDCLGRDWQCGTIQVDYQLAAADRLDATYVGEDGARHHPVILHRAVLGSLERFIGILIEHYAGKFPLWLAPEQIRILPVAGGHLRYAQEVADRLTDVGLRTSVGADNETLGKRIRQARNDRVPYFAVVGDQEQADGTVSLQDQQGRKLGVRSIADLVAGLAAEVGEKRPPPA
jgi:threonyl-tRNA synthetase